MPNCLDNDDSDDDKYTKVKTSHNTHSNLIWRQWNQSWNEIDRLLCFILCFCNYIITGHKNNIIQNQCHSAVL